jgi:hypothetical protein
MKWTTTDFPENFSTSCTENLFSHTLFKGIKDNARRVRLGMMMRGEKINGGCTPGTPHRQDAVEAHCTT